MSLYKISAFSRLGQVSLKALRLYDQRGLLKPAKVDPGNSYRYYSLEQLSQLNRILALKAMGFSLEQIAQLISDNLSQSQLQTLLESKRTELQQRLADTQMSLTTLDIHLKHLEVDSTMANYNIILKSVESIGPVLSCRKTIPTYTAVGQLFTDMTDYLSEQKMYPSGFVATLWHDPEYQESDVDAEAVMAIPKALPDTATFKIHTLPSLETVASVIHHGPYSTLNQAYASITQWIEDNHYTITGPNREIYLKGGADQEDDSYITEIQFPVYKTTADVI